jgi:hypothetical protein
MPVEIRKWLALREISPPRSRTTSIGLHSKYLGNCIRDSELENAYPNARKDLN